MSEVRRVLPAVDGESRPYWEAAARGELAVRRCVECQRAHWYPRPHCPYCYADGTVWETCAGAGTVYTYTIVRQNSASSFRDWVPYAFGLVEMDGGPRVFGRIIGQIEELRVGSSVVVGFDTVGDMDLPVFAVGSDPG